MIVTTSATDLRIISGAKLGGATPYLQVTALFHGIKTDHLRECNSARTEKTDSGQLLANAPIAETVKASHKKSGLFLAAHASPKSLTATTLRSLSTDMHTTAGSTARRPPAFAFTNLAGQVQKTTKCVPN